MRSHMAKHENFGSQFCEALSGNSPNPVMIRKKKENRTIAICIVRGYGVRNSRLLEVTHNV